MESKPINDIRVGMNSRVRNVVRYCNSILNEKKTRDLKFSAVGGAIGRLVNVVEVLRIVNPGLHQSNKIGTVIYQTVDQQGSVQSGRNYPKLEVVLSLDQLDKTEGYQAPLSEEERTKLFELMNVRPERTEDEGERGTRGRGTRGGFSRGGRGFSGRGGFSRGGRGGFSRGGREGFSRGGYSRGGYSRGGEGYSRGGYSRGSEGYSRGGYSRGSEGYSRGSEGYSRGGYSRGGEGYSRGGRDSFRGRGYRGQGRGRGAPRGRGF
jgi:hypothetical protein